MSEKKTITDDQFVEAAREAETDELEIETQSPVVTRVEGGAWVSAWVWVADEAIEDDAEDTEGSPGPSARW